MFFNAEIMKLDHLLLASEEFLVPPTAYAPAPFQPTRNGQIVGQPKPQMVPSDTFLNWYCKPALAAIQREIDERQALPQRTPKTPQQLADYRIRLIASLVDGFLQSQHYFHGVWLVEHYLIRQPGLEGGRLITEPTIVETLALQGLIHFRLKDTPPVGMFLLDPSLTDPVTQRARFLSPDLPQAERLDRITQIIVVNAASNSPVAIQSPGAQLHAATGITAGDITSLLATVLASGVSTVLAEQLKQLVADPGVVNAGLDHPQVQGWIGDVASSAAASMSAEGVMAGGQTVLEKLPDIVHSIGQFFGG